MQNIARAIRTGELRFASHLLMYHEFHRFHNIGPELVIRPLYAEKAGFRAANERQSAINTVAIIQKDVWLSRQEKPCKR